jgi:Na+-driven multidrug efflux pump
LYFVQQQRALAGMSAAINTFVGNYTSTGKHDATPKISISLHAGCVVLGTWYLVVVVRFSNVCGTPKFRCDKNFTFSKTE